MKKYIWILLLAVFVIPSIVMASWWNPFSWFKRREKLPEAKLVQVQQEQGVEVQAPVVADTQPTAPDVNIIAEDIVKKVKSIKKIVPIAENLNTDKVVNDVCIDIDGVQAVVPSGYVRSDLGSCTLIKPDLGVQQTVVNPANAALVEELKKDYNLKVSSLNKQILSLRTQFYASLLKIEKAALSTAETDAKKKQLYADTNTKTDQLGQQIEQLTIEYNNNLSKLR